MDIKNIYKLGAMGVIVLSGCATNVAHKDSVKDTKTRQSLPQKPSAQSSVVVRRLNDCIIKSNQSADALLVDSQIIAVTRNNPHAKALFAPPDKLIDQQAVALTNYLAEANTCRPIAIEGLSQEMVTIYEDFFKKN